MIAIKDIEMPSSCYDCPFAKNERTNDYGSFCECGVLEDYETINLLEHSKHSNCPLVEQEPILGKVKQAREEIQKLVDMCGSGTVGDLNMKSGLGLALEKIDKLIESEG